MGQQGTLFVEEQEEYLVVASLPVSYLSKINEIRQKLARLVGSPVANSVPHITVYYRLFEGDYKDVVLRLSEEVLQNIPGFEIELCDWQLFDNPRSKEKIIVLKVNDPRPFKRLAKLFSKKIRKNFPNETPHLTLMRGLSGEGMERLTPVLNDIRFNMKFKCDKLTLLRRELHDGEWTKYEAIREFTLK